MFRIIILFVFLPMNIASMDEREHLLSNQKLEKHIEKIENEIIEALNERDNKINELQKEIKEIKKNVEIVKIEQLIKQNPGTILDQSETNLEDEDYQKYVACMQSYGAKFKDDENSDCCSMQ